jgi:hypothetical protein
MKFILLLAVCLCGCRSTRSTLEVSSYVRPMDPQSAEVTTTYRIEMVR